MVSTKVEGAPFRPSLSKSFVLRVFRATAPRTSEKFKHMQGLTKITEGPLVPKTVKQFYYIYKATFMQ